MRFCILFLLVQLCLARDLFPRQKRDGDLLAGLGNILSGLGLSGGNNGNPPNPNPNPNPNKQGLVQPDGKLSYCDQNPADCAYLNCLADNFQHSPNSANAKMGGRILTDPQLRQTLQTDPTVSKAACDRINLNGPGCDKFKQFLGLLDTFSPGGEPVPGDPNRGKRSPDGQVNTNLGTNTRIQAVGTNANANTNANLGVGNNNNNNNDNRNNNNNQPRPNGQPGNGPSGSGPPGNAPSGNGPSGNGQGHHVDYYDDHHPDSHGPGSGSGPKPGSGPGSGSGSGSGPSGAPNGQPAPAYVQRDCNALLPKNQGPNNKQPLNNNRGH